MNTEERAIREALYKLLKTGANMLTNGISEDIGEWDLPKTTPISAKRKIIREACRWNDLNRRRAIELKGEYDRQSKQQRYERQNQRKEAARVLRNTRRRMHHELL